MQAERQVAANIQTNPTVLAQVRQSAEAPTVHIYYHYLLLLNLKEWMHVNHTTRVHQTIQTCMACVTQRFT